MADNAIEVKIGANVDGFRRGSREAKQHVDSLLDTLKAFKSEQVSQSRTARFYASEIAEIIPASDGAKRAIQGLISVGLGGAGWMMAFEGAIFVLKQLKEHFDEGAKAAKKLQETSEKLSDALQKVRDSFGPPKSDTQKAWEEWLKPLHKEMNDLQKEIDKLVDASALIGVLIPTEGLEEKKAALAGLIESKRPEKDATEEDEGRDRANKEAIERESKLREQGRADLIKSIDDNIAEYERELRALEKIQDERVADSKKLIEQGKKDYLKSIDDQIAEEERLSAMLRKIDADRLADRKKKLKEEIEFTASNAKVIGEAFGAVFVDMATGAQNAAQIVTKMVNTLVQAYISAAIVSIQASALKAGAEAAASQAGVPIIGPILALSAMGAMVSAVLGLLGSLPSAAGGMLVAHDTLAMVHEDERILPARYAEGLDEMVLNGGGGGVTVNIHGAIDGNSFRQLFNNPGFVREFRDAIRRGRI